MNLPTDEVKSLEKRKMFKSWLQLIVLPNN